MLLAALLSFSSVDAVDPPLTSISFAPDGNSVVACSQAGLQVFRWPGLGLEKRVELHADNVHDLVFSADGSRLAIAGGEPGESGSIEILNWPQCEMIQRLHGHSDCVIKLQWLAENRLASASLDHQVCIWNLETKRVEQTLAGHSGGVCALSLLPEEKLLVSGGLDNSLRVWDLQSGELTRSLTIHTRAVTSLAVRPIADELPMIASASRDQSVRLWQPTIGRMVRFARLESIPLDIAWTTDGSAILASCEDGSLVQIDAQTVTTGEPLKVLDGPAYCLTLHRRGLPVILAGESGLIRRVAAVPSPD
ncbi:WD40 repeat domain-containing protein [Stieleria tagensis]|uniref:WD40 repeat domain-containing protein n=1 Tax=Stieleria tagensis TaxID=2956795 RepID=UPI00209B8F71|nr:WD40 repeat domain-containing protein [Stieleria tagensis]